MNVRHFSPCVCMVCGYNACYDELPICVSCAQRFYSMLRVPCKSCGRTPFECDCPNGDGFRFLFFFGGYDSKKAVYSVKLVRDTRDIAFYADMLIRSFGINSEKYDAVTYVPRTKKAKRRYGVDQSEVIAKVVSDKTGVPAVTFFERIGSREQKLLSYSERKKNIKNAFCLKYIPNEKYKRILLVDDIVTTGATLSVCAELLRKNAAKRVVPIAIAKTNFSLRKQFDF